MSIKKDPSGRRSIQVEVEVPGTPDEVWQAIATGPGISAWFCPAEFEEVDGKPVTATLNFGPGMESRSVVTVWDSPRMITREADRWVPGSPLIATEFTVEARAGGGCVVRVVNSLFASTDDWDKQLEGTESGWNETAVAHQSRAISSAEISRITVSGSWQSALDRHQPPFLGGDHEGDPFKGVGTRALRPRGRGGQG